MLYHPAVPSPRPKTAFVLLHTEVETLTLQTFTIGVAADRQDLHLHIHSNTISLSLMCQQEPNMWSSSSRIQASLFGGPLSTRPCPPATQQPVAASQGSLRSRRPGERRRGHATIRHQPLHRIRVRPAATTLHLVRMWLHTVAVQSAVIPTRTTGARAVSLALHGFQSASQRHASHRTRTVSERSSQASQGGPRPPKKLRQGGLRPPPSS